MIKFTISGNPISSKNSIRSGTTKDGRNYTYTVKAIKVYRDNALRQINEQLYHGLLHEALINDDNKFLRPIPITDYIQVSFIFYCKDNRKRDLINLIQCPADLLQQAGIILNDYLIVSLDGSRIMGIDKSQPRTEIIINEI